VAGAGTRPVRVERPFPERPGCLPWHGRGHRGWGDPSEEIDITNAAGLRAGRWFALAMAGKGKMRTKEATMPRAQIKDEKTYQELRDKGESKEKSARIANAAAGSSRSQVGRKGGKRGSYEVQQVADQMESLSGPGGTSVLIRFDRGTKRDFT
jgi:hypothetical protein